MGFNARYFELAKLASNQSSHHYRMGAVIVLHRPVSIGFNQNKSHPKYADGRRTYSIHAEVSALLRARCDVTGGTIYIHRQDRNGNVSLARPCPNCLKALIESGIKRIYYTTNWPPYWKAINL